MECIFCKIASGIIPAAKVYEDKDFLAFLDISPVNKGHTLVITKRHYQTFLDLPEKELTSINKVCQRISIALMKATNAHGFNLVMNNNPAAGQIVFHAHFHIVPRFSDDGHKFFPSEKLSYIKDEDRKLAERIKSLL